MEKKERWENAETGTRLLQKLGTFLTVVWEDPQDNRLATPALYHLWDVIKCGIPAGPGFEEKNRGLRMETTKTLGEFNKRLLERVRELLTDIPITDTTNWKQEISHRVYCEKSELRKDLLLLGKFAFPGESGAYWEKRVEFILNRAASDTMDFVEDFIGLLSATPEGPRA